MAVETFREETFFNPFQEILISPLSLKLEFTTIIHIGALIRIKIRVHWLRSYGMVYTYVCDVPDADDHWSNQGFSILGSSTGYAEAGETWTRQKFGRNPRPRGPCLVTK